MKLIFVSNYFNHQQMPLCERLYKHFGEEFIFLATKPMKEERKKLGYGMDSLPSYVICAYDMEKDKDKCIKLIDGADMVLFGSAPELLIKNRIKDGKVIIRYSERPLKNGCGLLKYLPRLIKWHKENPRNKPIYMLCASAYTAYDYSRFFLFRNRMYKWGYFPETKEHDIEDLILNKERNSVLWCGRFIDWKHPDDAVRAVKILVDRGYSPVFRFIGTGDMEDKLKKLVKELGLSCHIEFLGSMPPDEVRKYMESSEIFVATSDFKEGWGAVVNEAMASGCAIVASHAMGSVPYLIANNENGHIYQSGNADDLADKIGFLLDNTDERKKLGKNAYSTITGLWNADSAADRLVKLISGIMEGRDVNFSCGPCSKSDIIKNNWIKSVKPGGNNV